MSFRCMQIFMWTVPLSLLAPTLEAKPVVIYGNAYGLWSPTHPHLTSGRTKPNTPVLYQPPTPEPEQEPVVAETPAACPTLQSAPHLCPPT